MDWMELERRAAAEREAQQAARGGGAPHNVSASAPPVDRPAGLDLLAGLNADQLAAVTHRGGPLSILAGPGSGKTRVITRRIAWLVREAGVQPWEIVAITFTNKAAKEMRERVEALLPVKGAWVSTFHAFCARVLRREIEILGGYTRDFTIYDTGDKNTLLKRIIKELGYDITRFRPAAIGGWISERKNRAREDRVATESEEDGMETEVLKRVEKRYEETLRSSNALDFDDLLLKVLHLFETHPGVRDAYARRFRHVLVDEYQDTNHVQYLLARHLASFHGNLAVCGDPDQSIYSWRGADIRNILDFARDYPNAKVVRLEQNYRSTGNILRAAESVIRHNAGRAEKRIWSDKGPGEKLAVLQCADEDDEAREVALQIRALHARGLPLGSVAVFYRVNFMQRALEQALRLARIPYQIIGGLEFYDRREIRDLIAYLKLIVNPNDDLAFQRVVNVPQRGVGDKSLELLVQWAADRRVPLTRALQSEEALGLVKGRGKSGLVAFRELLVRLQPAQDADAAVALDLVLAEIGVDAWLAQLDDESGVDREANIEELRAHAAAWDRMTSELRRQAGVVEPVTRGAEAVHAELAGSLFEHAARERRAAANDANANTPVELPPTGVRGFLQEIALVNDTDALEDGTGKVTLMTLHSAKGLEFPAVFLCGVEEELLPHSRALEENIEGDPDAGVEEERRLFYVGLTRAQERLVLTHCQQRMHFGQTNFCSPSRFLEEIPHEVIEGGSSLGTTDDEDTDDAQDDGLGAYTPSAKAPAIAEGDRVESEHFGRGTVERLQGTGVNARATVRFPQHGTKILLLQYAKLRVLGRA
jgi:DNA helicase-2/ATP-dependent DNA helicase PcrA